MTAHRRVLRAEPLEGRHLLAGMFESLTPGGGVLSSLGPDNLSDRPPADLGLPPQAGASTNAMRDFLPPMAQDLLDGMEGLPGEDMPPDGPSVPVPVEAHHFVARLRFTGDQQAADGGGATGDFLPVRPRGLARLVVNLDETAVRFRLRIPKLAGVVSAQVHLGTPGEGGPAVATMVETPGDAVEGIMVRGTWRDDDIAAVESIGFDGTVASLAKWMREGKAYIEVDTADQDGILRGVVHPFLWRPWHNPIHRMDVSGDRFVTPRDALIVLDDLNQHGARLVEAGFFDGFVSDRFFVDVTGDNIVSPRDALEVLSYLAEQAQTLTNEALNVPPEAVSATLSDLEAALDVPLTDWINEVDRAWENVDAVFSQAQADLDAILDGLNAAWDDWQTDVASQIGQWIGQADEQAQRWIDRFRQWQGDTARSFEEWARGIGDAWANGFPRWDGGPNV